MNAFFQNNVTLKSGQLLNAVSKHCSSFNCMKSLKTFFLTPKTSNHIWAESSARYHSPNKTIRKKCSYSELFCSVFSRIWTRITPELLWPRVSTKWKQVTQDILMWFQCFFLYMFICFPLRNKSMYCNIYSVVISNETF